MFTDVVGVSADLWPRVQLAVSVKRTKAEAGWLSFHTKMKMMNLQYFDIFIYI